MLFLFAFAAMQSFCLAGLDTDIASTNRTILNSGDWNPSQQDVPKVLLAVQSLLHNPVGLDEYSKADVKIIRKRSKNYRVQFAGVIRDGKKVIWCNFFPAHQNDKERFPYWKERKVRVFDGGAWFCVFIMIQAHKSVSVLNRTVSLRCFIPAASVDASIAPQFAPPTAATKQNPNGVSHTTPGLRRSAVLRRYPG